jgi:DNA-binding transcriptional LysR family regulator
MQVNPYRLLVLRAVVDAGGVVAAGRQLHLAPSGVSQHLAALERETGLILVDRSRRGGQRSLRLTAAGLRLAGHAARLAEVLEDVHADVVASTGAVHGPVTLATFPTAINRLVVPALAALAAAHEGVEPRVVQLDDNAVMTALHAGQIDLALTEDDALRPTHEHEGRAVHRLLDDPYRLAVPAGWPTPHVLTDLAERPWIEGPPDSPTARVLDRLRTTTGAPFAGRHSGMEFPAVLALVGAGLGAALVPDLALTAAPPPTVRIVGLAGLGARSINAVHLRSRRTRPVVQATVDALRTAGRRDRGTGVR